MKREAIYCFDTATVRFAIYPDGFDGARVVAQIGEDPLRDLFGAKGGGDTLLAAYDRHADAIDALAAAHFHRAPQQAIVLHTKDFEFAAMYRVEQSGITDPVIETGRLAANHSPSELAA